MTAERIETTLGQIVTLQRGYDLPSQARVRGPIPIMGSAGITGYHNQASTEGPGVVVGRSGVGSMGVVSYIDCDFWALNTTLFVSDFHGNNRDFVYYLLKTINFRQFDTGSAQASLNRNAVYPHRVTIPGSAETQRDIAAFLRAIDERIILLREANATLEAIAQVIFKSWFVDFEPIHSKNQGLAPAGMDDATASLFPDSFTETMLGPIPAGWTVLPVGEAVDCVGGATPATRNPDYWSPEEHAWTTPKDLSGLQAPVLLNTERRLSTNGLAKIGSGLLPAGTLLLSSRAPIGYLAISQVPVAINQGYIAMPPGGRLPPLYMLFWCRQNMEGIKARANGSTFMEISKKAFRPIPALVPSSPVIEAFQAAASPLFSRLVSNEQQAQTLATLRDHLLPRLISGQVRLPAAAVQIAETCK